MLLDQYYTKTNISRYCIDVLKDKINTANYLWVEPSAGTGSFLNWMPAGSLAYDLDPKAPNIIKEDFLTVDIECKKDILVVGNPPFGKNSSMALKFFNHAATMADIIAFILPRTFRKASMINRLDRRFHCIHDEILPADSFIFEGETYDVPCTFQIWKKCSELRTMVETTTTHDDFEFTTREHADFALQRVGVNAGRIKTDLTVSRQSHYFIRGPIDVFKQINFNSVKHDTAGNPSIAKSEIVQLFCEIVKHIDDRKIT